MEDDDQLVMGLIIGLIGKDDDDEGREKEGFFLHIRAAKRR